MCVTTRLSKISEKKVHRDKQVEQEVTRRSNSIGSQNDSNNNNNNNSNNILNSSALFERLKELEDAEYYSNLAESDKNWK